MSKMRFRSCINLYKILIYRSSHQGCSIIKSVLRNFAKFTGKHLCKTLFFNKVAGLRLATLLKKRLWRTCFPVNFEKFLRTPFLQNTSGRFQENCPQGKLHTALILTLILNQTLTLNGGQFSSGAIFRTPLRTTAS